MNSMESLPQEGDSKKNKRSPELWIFQYQAKSFAAACQLNSFSEVQRKVEELFDIKKDQFDLFCGPTGVIATDIHAMKALSSSMENPTNFSIKVGRKDPTGEGEKGEKEEDSKKEGRKAMMKKGRSAANTGGSSSSSGNTSKTGTSKTKSNNKSKLSKNSKSKLDVINARGEGRVGSMSAQVSSSGSGFDDGRVINSWNAGLGGSRGGRRKNSGTATTWNVANSANGTTTTTNTTTTGNITADAVTADTPEDPNTITTTYSTTYTGVAGTTVAEIKAAAAKPVETERQITTISICAIPDDVDVDVNSLNYRCRKHLWSFVISGAIMCTVIGMLVILNS